MASIIRWTLFVMCLLIGNLFLYLVYSSAPVMSLNWLFSNEWMSCLLIICFNFSLGLSESKILGLYNLDAKGLNGGGK